jgi:hypothetical protein
MVSVLCRRNIDYNIRKQSDEGNTGKDSVDGQFEVVHEELSDL